MKGYYKRLSEEDKFARKYYCCFQNHGGFSKVKRANRRTARRALKKELADCINEI